MIKHVKSVWVYNNTDDVIKVYFIKENIYKEVCKMFTTDSFNINKGQLALKTTTAFTGSTKVELIIDVKKESLVKDLSTHYTKIDSNKNAEFIDCEANDKSKIMSLCNDLLNQLDDIYSNLITFSRKMESLVGYVAKENLLNITFPLGMISTYGIPTRVDLRTAMNVAYIGNDIRSYIEHIFTDIKHVIKAATYYAK